MNKLVSMFEELRTGQSQIQESLVEQKKAMDDRFGTIQNSMNTMTDNMNTMNDELERLKSLVSNHDETLSKGVWGNSGSGSGSGHWEAKDDANKRRRTGSPSFTKPSYEESKTQSTSIHDCRVFVENFPVNYSKEQRKTFLDGFLDGLGTMQNVRGKYETFCRGPRVGSEAILQFESPEAAKQFVMDNKEEINDIKVHDNGSEFKLYFNLNKSKAVKKKENCVRLFGKFITENSIFDDAEVETDKRNAVVIVNNVPVIKISINKDDEIKYFVDKRACQQSNVDDVFEKATSAVNDFSSTFQ